MLRKCSKSCQKQSTDSVQSRSVYVYIVDGCCWRWYNNKWFSIWHEMIPIAHVVSVSNIICQLALVWFILVVLQGSTNAIFLSNNMRVVYACMCVLFMVSYLKLEDEPPGKLLFVILMKLCATWWTFHWNVLGTICEAIQVSLDATRCPSICVSCFRCNRSTLWEARSINRWNQMEFFSLSAEEKRMAPIERGKNESSVCWQQWFIFGTFLELVCLRVFFYQSTGNHFYLVENLASQHLPIERHGMVQRSPHLVYV